VGTLDPKFELVIKDLHSSMLKANELDEGDLIFYRINYRLIDTLGISKDEAEKIHAKYHEKYPRKISEGFCHECQKAVKLLPIIYGIQKSELMSMQQKAKECRIIIGDTGAIREGEKVALFGCKECKQPLPNYGIA
jgi:hypothetical protein